MDVEDAPPRKHDFGLSSGDDSSRIPNQLPTRGVGINTTAVLESVKASFAMEHSAQLLLLHAGTSQHPQHPSAKKGQSLRRGKEISHQTSPVGLKEQHLNVQK